MAKKFIDKEFCLEVTGDYACFTRPEMKVERVSYDVITPSAARAVFTAIFWKPAIRWRVTKIEVLNPIRWTSVRRNEVGVIASDRSDGILIEDQRQQRAGLFLRDVAYRIYACLEFIPPEKRHKAISPLADHLVDPVERAEWAKDENPGKYNAMFERRATKGQCFNQPYLGCREFSCAFRLISDPAAESLIRPAIEESRDLGFMLFDMDFGDELPEKERKDSFPKPMFFRPQIVRGSITVPAVNSEEVRK